jgi:hypothetical protein
MCGADDNRSMTDRSIERHDVRDDQPLADPLPSTPEACPRCGSPNIRRFPRLVFALLALVLVVSFDVNMNGGVTEFSGIGVGTVALVAILMTRWRCRDCGNSW